MASDERNVDRREVVQVSTILFCPSMGDLRILVLLILLLSDRDSTMATFVGTSWDVHGLPEILFFLKKKNSRI